MRSKHVRRRLGGGIRRGHGRHGAVPAHQGRGAGRPGQVAVAARDDSSSRSARTSGRSASRTWPWPCARTAASRPPARRREPAVLPAVLPGRQRDQAAGCPVNRPLPRWPLYLIAAPAAVAVWSGWVGLGTLCGFGVVHPLPGIADSFTINTAITLPVGVEAYGAYALRAWLTPGTSERPGSSPGGRRSAALRSACSARSSTTC